MSQQETSSAQYEFDDTEAGRDIGVEKSKHGLYEELKEKKGSPFYKVSLRDIFLFTVGFGRKHGDRQELEGKTHWMFGRDRLTDEQEWVIKSIAVKETGTPEVLRDEKQVYRIAQEYANGGIEELHRRAFDPDEDPFSDLTTEVVRQHRTWQE